ncbi:hypothetical protein L1987_22185 [Smallanthus sonchifolius]|uniref:Uncharacterized protein n=1 Tax=Smallanthus sonchifolius TaxID=185202 RepID=A0ACB9IES4_9ASTR|nr:hypothetical protein L1987_22185 [Smallanthus sonchifolius]
MGDRLHCIHNNMEFPDPELTAAAISNVSKVAFELVGRMSRLAGDKLVDSENSVVIRSNWVSSMVVLMF